MVHTVNAIITATLALGAAAPILAAPVERRIDSGFSSVNSRAPILPPSSGVGSVGSGTPAPVLYLISGLNLTSRAIDDELYVAARAPGGGPAAEAPATPSNSGQRLPKQGSRGKGSRKSAFGSIDEIIHNNFPPRPKPPPPPPESVLLEPKPSTPLPGIGSVVSGPVTGRDLEDLLARSFGTDELD